MPKYEVEIVETLTRVVEVEAANIYEAADIVEDMWKNSDMILDADDFSGVEFCARKVTE